MRIALYCRVSSDKQDNANQLDQLREFVSTQQGWILVLNFVDTVTGSGKKNRPPIALGSALAHRTAASQGNE